MKFNTNEQQKINSSKSLSELCNLLNEIGEYAGDFVDTTSLPVFSESCPKNTSEIFSWDDKNILVAGNEWEIEQRCPRCNEATFHCICKD